MIRVAWPALAVLALLVVWWQAMLSGRVGQLTLAESPDGTEVTLSLYDVAEILGPERYRLRRGRLSFVVAGPVEGMTVGQEVTVQGVIGEGVVVEAWRRSAPGRPAKKALGLLGIGLVVLFAGASVRWTPGGLALRG